jgi:hypothetical protein
MQNDIVSDLFNSIAPQTLGQTDSLSILGLSLVGPGLAIFAVVFIGRQIFRPRWRGYWDAV